MVDSIDYLDKDFLHGWQYLHIFFVPNAYFDFLTELEKALYILELLESKFWSKSFTAKSGRLR